MRNQIIKVLESTWNLIKSHDYKTGHSPDGRNVLYCRASSVRLLLALASYGPSFSQFGI
jgi:hypothetical protein